MVHHYFPKLVELHNYSPANSLRQKLYNWGTLNQKVFKRLGYEVKRGDVESIVNCKPGVIEAVLMELQQKVRVAQVVHSAMIEQTGFELRAAICFHLHPCRWPITERARDQLRITMQRQQASLPSALARAFTGKQHQWRRCPAAAAVAVT